MYPLVCRADSGIEGSGGVVASFRAGGSKQRVADAQAGSRKPAISHAWKSFAPQLDTGKPPASYFAVDKREPVQGLRLRALTIFENFR